MLVGRPLSSDEDVRSIKRNDLWRAADRAAGEVLDRLSLQYALYPSRFGVVRDPWFRAADVVQLYNLHGSYFSFTALPRLTSRRPTFWILQDQWAMTGHVAYSHDCERWRVGCGSCPYLPEDPAPPRDTTPTLADVLTKTAPEAIASGVPCVAFDRGGVTDVVRQMETGYQARFGDVADLARGLELLLGDDDLRARLGRQGRELAGREFSSRVQVDRYVDLYRSKLER